MNIYEKLRTRICELIPEILELKTGCKFETDGVVHTVLYDNKNGVDDDEYDLTTSVSDGTIREIGSEYVLGNIPEFLSPKIIGRDITLEDVMMLVGKINDNWSRPLYYLTPSEDYCSVYIKEKYGFKWQLCKPLYQQLESTQLAILELIK